MRGWYFIVVLMLVAGQAMAQKPVLPPAYEFHTSDLDPSTPIHLYVKGNSDEVPVAVNRVGGNFKYFIGSYAAVVVRKDLVPDLISQPEIESFHFEFSKGQPLLNESRVNSGIDRVQAGVANLPSGFTGKDVVIGMIDAGIDLNHPDFQDENGKTRVVHLWDQNMPVNANTPFYGYGQEFDSAAINAGNCPHEDQAIFFGHGTNTTGIAAGNGLSDPQFTGCAPDADIIVVSSIFTSPTWSATIADAVDYIFAKAEAMGKPCVINASLGDYLGSHDGRDLATTAIKNLLKEQPGRIMVCAAGNSGLALPYHLGYQVNSDTNFTWFETEDNAISGLAEIFFEVYGNANDFEGINFAIGADQISPYYNFAGNVDFGNVTDWLGTVSSEELISANGNYLATVKTYADSLNGTYRLQILIDSIDSVDYRFRLMTVGSGRLDVWSTEQSFIGLFDMTYQGLPTAAEFPDITHYKAPDYQQQIVGYWACADEVITVGNYINRTEYIDVDENLVSFSTLVQGALSVTSSRGPSRLQSVKPEIVAPGDVTLTAGPADVIQGQLDNNQRDRVAVSGMHHRVGGTSSASPVIAGLACLFLEACPNANWLDFREAVISGAYADVFTNNTPNDRWGYGKVDAVATMLHHTPQPFLFAASNQVCEGDTLLVNAPSGFTSYTWSNGDTNSAIRVTGSGNFFVKSENELGCKGMSDTLLILQRPKPGVPGINLDGQQPACANTPVVLSVLGDYGGYFWSNGSFQKEISVSQTGNYMCTVSNQFGCEEASLPVSVSIYPSISEPQLHLQADNKLAIVHDSMEVPTYRWYRNGVFLAEVSDQKFEVINTGSYSAEMIDTNLCTWPTNTVYINALSMDQLDGQSIRVMPNPFDHELRIDTDLKGYQWNLFDASGRLLVFGNTNKCCGVINLEFLLPGVYVLELTGDDGVIYTERVVRR